MYDSLTKIFILSSLKAIGGHRGQQRLFEAAEVIWRLNNRTCTSIRYLLRVRVPSYCCKESSKDFHSPRDILDLWVRDQHQHQLGFINTRLLSIYTSSILCLLIFFFLVSHCSQIRDSFSGTKRYQLDLEKTINPQGFLLGTNFVEVDMESRELCTKRGNTPHKSCLKLKLGTLTLFNYRTAHIMFEAA